MKLAVLDCTWVDRSVKMTFSSASRRLQGSLQKAVMSLLIA